MGVRLGNIITFPFPSLKCKPGMREGCWIGEMDQVTPLAVSISPFQDYIDIQSTCLGRECKSDCGAD